MTIVNPINAPGQVEHANNPPVEHGVQPSGQVVSIDVAAQGAQLQNLSGFLEAVLPPRGHYCLFLGKTKRHVWAETRDALEQLIRERSGEVDQYFATASFKTPDNRKQDNVAELKALRLDIDAGADKFARNPDGAYPTQRDAAVALIEFTKATTSPSLIVASGAGLHVYYVLEAAITPAEWTPLALALKAKCEELGFKADPAVTTDTARVLRAPGTLHKSGAVVRLLKDTKRVYTAVELGTLLGAKAAPKYDTGINAEALDGAAVGPPKSINKIIEKCAAIAHVHETRGNVPEPYWRAMLGVVKFTVEGDEAAHAMSDGYAGYDFRETEKKLERWTAGPSTCAEFAKHTKACATCPHNGKIKSPIVLGYVAPDRVVVGAVAAEQEGEDVPDYVTELNARFAVVRRGGTMCVADFGARFEVAGGEMRLGLDFLPFATLQELFNNKDIVFVGRKPMSKAEAWRKHPKRREYPEGAMFAPGETLGPGLLNMWTGFAVEPKEGDITPWLHVLDAVAPDQAVRDYVLKWLAWKVQNPGGVPGTILLATGPKGGGKNSLFEPIVRMFGSHGCVLDDAEQVAGRFNGHMQDKAFALLDEAMFTGDRKQGDRIKSRVTATSTTYESKHLPPVAGTNRCAYVSVTNHTHVWQATIDERRAAVIESGGSLRGNAPFWNNFYAWMNTGGGVAALLHYLQQVDLRGFNVRKAPDSAALRRQIAQTCLTSAPVSWCHQILTDGEVRGRSGGVVVLNENTRTEVAKSTLRESFEMTSGSKRPGDYDQAMRWMRDTFRGLMAPDKRRQDGGWRVRSALLPSCADMRRAFSAATGVDFDDFDDLEGEPHSTPEGAAA